MLKTNEIQVKCNFTIIEFIYQNRRSLLNRRKKGGNVKNAWGYISPVRFASVFQKVYLRWNLWQAASSALYENTIFRRHKNRQRKSTPGLIVGHRKASDSDGRRQSIYETRRKFFPCRRATGTGDWGLRCHGPAVWTRKKKGICTTMAADKGVLGMNSRRVVFFPALELSDTLSPRIPVAGHAWKKSNAI